MQTAICCCWVIFNRHNRLHAESQRLEVAACRNRVTELEAARIKAEKAAQAQSECLANTSHELRTLINGVLGVTELLLDSPLSTEQQDIAELIKDSGNALLTLLNDVLDLSKIEAGCLSVEPAPVQLREFIEQLGSLLAPKADDKKIELAVRVDPAIPETVGADPTRLRQVILNLMSNAIKFTQAGHVRLGVDLLSKENHSCRLRFCVSDTGIGIPAERLSAIFDRFTQADGSTTRNFGGTGLGLTISKALVELMGGQLSVASQMGVGSQFEFTLNLPMEGETRGVRAPGSFSALQGKQVLLVCSRNVTQSVVREMMESWGAQVYTIRQWNERENEQNWEAIVEYRGGLPNGERSTRIYNAPVIFLTTGGEHLLLKPESRQALPLPVQGSKLYTALSDAVSAKKDHNTLYTHQLPLSKGQNLSSSQILLADDNLFNQRVA